MSLVFYFRKYTKISFYGNKIWKSRLLFLHLHKTREIMKDCILVTGGAGYIGSVLVEKLCDAGYSVLVVDDLRDGKVKAVDKRAVFYEHSYGDISVMMDIFRMHHPVVVVHLAASASVPESVEKPLHFYHNNVASTIHMLGAMKMSGVNKIIFASTSALGGAPYGNSKWMCEQIIQDCAKASALSYYIFRFYCVAGATSLHGESRVKETHLIPRIIDVALGKQKELEIYGDKYPTRDGTAIRDYIHVEDIVDAIMITLPFNGERNITLELGTGTGYSVLDTVKLAEKALGVQIPYSIKEPREGDEDIIVLDTDIGSYYAFDWQAKRSLGDILRSAYEWRKNPLY